MFAITFSVHHINLSHFIFILLVSLSIQEAHINTVATKLEEYFNSPMEHIFYHTFEKSNINVTIRDLKPTFDYRIRTLDDDYKSPKIRYDNLSVWFSFTLIIEFLSSTRNNIIISITNSAALLKYKNLVFYGLEDNSFTFIKPIFASDISIHLGSLQEFSCFYEIFQKDLVELKTLFQSYWEIRLNEILFNYPKSIVQYNFEYLTGNIENYRKYKVTKSQKFGVVWAKLEKIKYKSVCKIGKLYGKFNNVSMKITYEKQTNEIIEEDVELKEIQVTDFKLILGEMIKGSRIAYTICDEIFQEFFRLIGWEE